MSRAFLITIFFLPLFGCDDSSETPSPLIQNSDSTIKEEEAFSIDTALTLKGSIFGNNKFTIRYGHVYKTRRQLVQLLKNRFIIATLKFPISDEEVRNFGIHEILETKEGFIIKSNWGGGNYFYDNDFHFLYENDSFYAHKVAYGFYQHDIDLRKDKDSVLPKPVNIIHFQPMEHITNFIAY